MSSSVNEILAKLRLERQDLNRLSSSQLRTIFIDLTVKEISLFCRINKRFNTICEDESFWRIKVLNDYGIEERYAVTWKQTAITMSIHNMINLNDKWINGRTYKEILNEALQQEYGPEFILDLQKLYLLPYANNSANGVWDLERCSDDEHCQEVANVMFGRDYTENELNNIFYIKNRQMTILHNAIIESEVHERFLISQLMYFSSLPDHRLNIISY